MTVLIKDFGNNSLCDTQIELKKTLLEKYRLKSISILSKQSSGIDKTTYVDVLADGTLIDTYNKQPISLTDLILI